MSTESPRNGMPAVELGGDGWTKPWSDNGGSCLEAKELPGGRVALRQSTDPRSPAPILEPNEIRAFVLGADWHERRGDRDRKISAHLRQLRALGLDVTIKTTQPSNPKPPPTRPPTKAVTSP